MTRETLKLRPQSRDLAIRWIDRAIARGHGGDAWSMVITDKRTKDQNAKLWPMLEDVARQVKWHGLTLSKDDWKLIFLASLNKELRIVPNLDGDGFVNLGRSSSRLSKAEFSDLIELIYAFGSRENVVWSDPTDRGANDDGVAA